MITVIYLFDCYTFGLDYISYSFSDIHYSFEDLFNKDTFGCNYVNSKNNANIELVLLYRFEWINKNN